MWASPSVSPQTLRMHLLSWRRTSKGAHERARFGNRFKSGSGMYLNFPLIQTWIRRSQVQQGAALQRGSSSHVQSRAKTLSVASTNKRFARAAAPTAVTASPARPPGRLLTEQTCERVCEQNPEAPACFQHRCVCTCDSMLTGYLHCDSDL